MKKYILPVTFILVFIVPHLLFRLAGLNSDSEIESVIHVDIPTVQPEPQQSTVISVKNDDLVMEMELETYVLGVLLGEMPASFEEEALKAQAVATRTYTMRRVSKQSKHDDANICTEATCCQAYMDISEYLSHRGSSNDLEKLRNAVLATAGQVLTYEGNLIEATYFSCSGGQTEDAVDVWGVSVPYLQSVSSPGEEDARHYRDEIEFSKQTFLSKLGLPESLQISENKVSVTYTQGGGVDTLRIGDAVFSGVQVRSLLSLPSAAFTLSIVDDTLLITTKGNGHRVGMSQYGADAMAVTGKRYEEILAHYYPGTKLETYRADQMQAVFDKVGNL